MSTDGMTVASLAEAIDAQVVAARPSVDVRIDRCNTLGSAGPGEVSFLSNAKYGRLLQTARATAVIVAANVTTARSDLILLHTKDPYYAWTRALELLHGHRRHPHAGVHPQAFVDPTACVGEGSILYPGVYVGPRAKVGRDCIVYPNVAIYDDCVIGDRVIIHSGASIGPDGFGFASHKDPDGVWRHHKIPQIGHVVIGDDVEIGSNTSIARGAVDVTRIGPGTKIDNNVTIGHGVEVGPHCLLIAHVGIAGSTVIGHHVTMAGQVGVAGHLKIGDGATLAAQTGVIADVEPGATMMGTPAMPVGQARRVYLHFTQLPDLVERIKQLEKQVKAISETMNDER